MKNRRFVTRAAILATIAVAIGYTFYTSFLNPKELVNVGDVAPNFALKDLAGNEIELAELKGKGVILNFWQTVCPPCREEMPHFETNYQKYNEQGFEVIAVNLDEPELTIQKFVDRYQLTFPILLDHGGQVSQVYGIGPLPATFLIDKNGVVIEKRIGGLTKQNVEDYVQKVLPSP